MLGLCGGNKHGVPGELVLHNHCATRRFCPGAGTTAGGRGAVWCCVCGGNAEGIIYTGPMIMTLVES